MGLLELVLHGAIEMASVDSKNADKLIFSKGYRRGRHSSDSLQKKVEPTTRLHKWISLFSNIHAQNVVIM